jgi:hypothetical protein
MRVFTLQRCMAQILLFLKQLMITAMYVVAGEQDPGGSI